jgi:hypothetical protein
MTTSNSRKQIGQYQRTDRQIGQQYMSDNFASFKWDVSFKKMYKRINNWSLMNYEDNLINTADYGFNFCTKVRLLDNNKN